MILGGDDILNSNIIINVNLSKKLQNINLMSGEKKFFLQLHYYLQFKMKPTPFCILGMKLEAAQMMLMFIDMQSFKTVFTRKYSDYSNNT